jgi:hypothetical protein
MIDQRSSIEISDDFAKCVHVDRLVPAPWNPNKQSERVFNNLVRNIQETGFKEAVEVVPLDDAHAEMREKYLTKEQAESGDLYYLIVGGHHRWEAAKVLDMEVIPVVRKPEFDEDTVKFQNVRMNMLRGKIDAQKFTDLYDEMADKYGEELAKEQMALVDEKEFKNLYKNIRDELPEEMQKKLDEAANEIQNVDDLSRLLNELFSKHGDTLEHSYMVFDFGGKTHLWVQMDRETKKQVESIKSFCYDHKLDINLVMQALLKRSESVIEEERDSLLANAEPETIAFE